MEGTLALSHKEFLVAARDHEQAASAAHLVYVSDSNPGISRHRRGKGFTYRLDGRTVKDPVALKRIHGLVIPPAWTRVWICPLANGHIQATGLDARRRKQYRYHWLWSRLRNETKFHRMYEFGKALPGLRERIEADLKSRELSREKVLATVLSLMERTYIRVGSNEYEKENGSYGLTTLKNRHVSISGDTMIFSFRGKKGIHHDIRLHNRRLARVVGQCREIPGRELFQYYDGEGARHSIDSGMVNQYIHAAVGEDFTAKDFRTWAGSLHALEGFKEVGEAAGVTECKKNLVTVMDGVSRKLGNSRAVCKKYYVHPGLIRLYEENKLVKYLGELDGAAEALDSGVSGVSSSRVSASGDSSTGASSSGVSSSGGKIGSSASGASSSVGSASGGLGGSSSGGRIGLSLEEEVLMKILRQYIRTAPIGGG